VIRSDLLALTLDTLAVLANRGLVKRAVKELDAGIVPELSLDADGTLHGRFPDGVRVTFPAQGGFEAATCGCAAPGACRHRVAVAIAYQRRAAAGDERPPGAEAPAKDAKEEEPTAFGPPPGDGAAGWSPGAFDDDLLARVLGARAVTAARRTLRAGYSARIRRSGPGDPSVVVELPACTVRFLVPGELGYVHTDAGAALRGEVITLAVWACRAADERGLRGPDVRVAVGGMGGGTAGGTGRRAAARGTGTAEAVDLANQVLLDGAVSTGPVAITTLTRAGRGLSRAGLHWPADAVAELAEQLAAYRERSAAYHPERLAALVAELHARHRAAGHDGGLPRAQVLGIGEQARTPLRQVRLVALGCRIGGSAGERTAEIYLAEPAAGVVLVLKRRWELGEGESPTGHDLAGRRVAGTALGVLAASNVVTENASRTAGREVHLGRGSLSRTTVTPVGEAWWGLPDPLLVRDLRRLDRELAALPPRPIRPRVRAELVRVVRADKIGEVGYDPGGQRLEVPIADDAGGTALVSAAYSPYCPAALDRLAETLAAPRTGPVLISGTVRRASGGLVIDPIAIAADRTVVVLDLAPGDGDATLALGAEPRPDPLGAALDGGVAVCAELAHRGLRHVTPAGLAALARAAGDLRAIGLRAAAALLDGLGRALRAGPPERAVDAWVDAYLHLATAVELR